MIWKFLSYHKLGLVKYFQELDQYLPAKAAIIGFFCVVRFMNIFILICCWRVSTMFALSWSSCLNLVMVVSVSSWSVLRLLWSSATWPVKRFTCKIKFINIDILNDFLRCLCFCAFGCGFLIFTAWLSRATNLTIMNHWQYFSKKKLGSWTIHKISDNSIFICQYKYFHSSITVLLSLSRKDRPFVNLDIAVMQSKSTDWYTPFNNRKKIHLQINNNCAMRHCTASRKIFSIAINELL